MLEPAARDQLHAVLLRLAAHHDPRYAPGSGEKLPELKAPVADRLRNGAP